MKHRQLEARLAALAAAYDLPAGASNALERLLERLGTADAPTAVHDRAEALDVHLADSLAGLRAPPLRQPGVIADLGAGAGLPGLVLAVAHPAAVVHEIESTGRKSAFIASTAQAMGLRNVRVVNGRAEEWAEGRQACDVVCARALAPLPVLLEYAAPLLRVGGSLVAWKGILGHTEAADGLAAAEELGFDEGDVIPVVPFRGAQRRALHVHRKLREPPPRYPRRAGMAVKRPIQAKT